MLPHEFLKDLRGHPFMTSTKKSKFFDHHPLCPQLSNLKDPPFLKQTVGVKFFITPSPKPTPPPFQLEFFKDFPRNNFAANSYRKQRKNLIVLFVTGIFILGKMILQIILRIYNYNRLNKRL